MTATVSDPGTATLSWPALPGAMSYTVFQGINGGPLALWGPAMGTTATVPLSQPNATHVFQVHALGPGGAALGVSNVTPPLTAGGVGVPSVPGTGVPSPAHARLVVPAPSVSLAASPAGATITAQVRDANNLPLAGVPVTAGAAPSGALITPVQPTTDGGGNAVFSATAPAGTTATINGTAAGVAVQPVAITFTP